MNMYEPRQRFLRRQAGTMNVSSWFIDGPTMGMPRNGHRYDPPRSVHFPAMGNFILRVVYYPAWAFLKWRRLRVGEASEHE